jgi:hypothetical protein
MPARDHDDDPPPAKGGFPLWLILVLGGVTVVVFGCGGVGTVMLLLYKRSMERQEVLVEQEMMMADREQALRVDRSLGGPPMDDGKVREMWRERLLANTVSREEFCTKVAGKTETEMTDALGEPDATEPDSRWVYKDRTQKPGHATA